MYTALKELGFDKYEPELKEFLRNYNSSKEDQARLQAQKRKAETQENVVAVQKRSQLDADDYQFE